MSRKTNQLTSVQWKRWGVIVACAVLMMAYSGSTPVMAQAGPAATPPNIVFLMADDMGYGDAGVYNSASKIPTPNLDRLASEGIRFTDAHGSAPLCTPARYSIQTGCYPWRADLNSNVDYFNEPLIDTGRMTVASMLRTHGYRTAAIGKWHLGLNVRNLDGEFVRATPGEILDSVDWTAPVEGGPLDYGFDYYYGDPGGPQVKAFVENRHYDMTPISKRGGKVFKSPNWNVRSQDVTHLNKSLEFIEDHHTANQINGDETPFFLYFAAVSPHEPAQPPVTVNGVPVQGVSSAGQRGDEVLAFDVMLGQIWDKLDELGITDNTLIIATSDNGPLIGNDEQYDHMSTGGLRGKKWNLWEGGHRVPFIARWGDGTHEGSMIPPGLVSDEIIGLHDLMATAADLVGATLPSDAAEDSESILPALFGEQFDGTIRSPIIHQKADKNRTFAVRDKEWKLILGDDQSTRLVETGQLYNLVDDLLETNNLYYQRSDVVTHLTGILTHYQRTGRSARRFATAPAPTAVEAGLVLLSLLLLHCAVTRIKRHWQGCVGRTALRLRKSPGTKWTI